MNLFLHIPKSAGSTLRYIIKEKYPHSFGVVNWHWTNWKDEIYLKNNYDFNKLSQNKIIYGHFNYGLHEHINEEVKYFTILRDPFKRVQSGYFHILRDSHSAFYREIKNMSFEEYLKSKLILDVDNGQVRRISGVGNEVPFGEITEIHYEKAIQNIEKHFLFVGLTENFNASLFLLSKLMNWKSPYYWTQNKGKNKKAELINPVDQQLVKDINQWDYKLYDYCRNKLDSQLSETDFDEQRFQFRNKLYNISLFPTKVLKKIKSKL
ncbi:hypothetical protein GCM10011506_12110 [Marivirga lumbricoides]|uniref:Sulfotransferase family protein n=1 Tax=Marivirga lumbricoides TaxID=1046115 RepID=A0ABQ1LUD2_9BACT|nr:hypothetical protein GCM10011506_12110 [Marivirga lumbricoides]